MESNVISHHRVPHLSILLTIGCIISLDLSYNILLSEQDHAANAPFCVFAEQLENNTTLRSLRLQGCGLNSQSAESLAKVLATNKHLEELNLNYNALCDDGIQHLAQALRVNQGLKELRLISCCMTDVGLEYLAQSLQYNNDLSHLLLWNLQMGSKSNIITEKVVPILTECLQNNHTLTLLELPRDFKSSTTLGNIEKAVNDVRKRSELPLIEVSGMSVSLMRTGCSYAIIDTCTHVLWLH